MRKTLALSLAAAATLAGGGAAYAQGAPRGDTTRAEAEQRSAEMFGRMDVNDDGVLNDADREAGRRQAFDSIDADKDGAISFAEFEAQRGDRREARAGRGGPGEPGSGRRGMPGMRGMHGPDGGGMARAADINSDGAISQDEFAAAALARFDRADTDKDGTIGQDERRESRRHMRDDRRHREAG